LSGSWEEYMTKLACFVDEKPETEKSPTTRKSGVPAAHPS
jgi:hypothetical protein